MKVKQLFFALVATIFAACTSEKEQISKTENGFQVFGEILIDGKPADLSRASGSWSGLGKYKGDQSASVSYSAPEGYTVTRVYETPTKNSSNTSSLTFSIDYTDHTVYADVKSTLQYTNTVTAGTGGTATGTYTGKTGDTHDIKATPNNGWTFSGWTTTGGAIVTSPSSASSTAKIGSSNGTITANFNSYSPSENYIFYGYRNDNYYGIIQYKDNITTFKDTRPYSMAYGNGRYVFVGRYGYIAYSSDGINWTTAKGVDESFNWYGICYGNGKFVAVGTNGHKAYSTDGVNWTINIGANINYTSICYGNGMFVAVSSFGDIEYSTDGIDWHWQLVSKGTSFESVCYGNGKFVAVSGSSKFAYSSDGVNWNTTSTGGKSLYNVCYGNGKFVSNGILNNIAYSTNGTYWIFTTVNGVWRDINYRNGGYVVVGDDGASAYSTDGINWISTNIGSSSIDWDGLCPVK